MTTHMLWAVFTLIAAAAQTARNAMQRELTATLGTVGATHVRFLFGFPFALVFLPGVMSFDRLRPAASAADFWPWVIAGALTQIAATATMLSVMGERSFVVAYAYIKTEPVQVALFGLIFLGDKITPLRGRRDPDRHRRRDRDFAQARRRQVEHHALDLHRPAVRRAVRALGHRLSRRHPVAASAAFRHGGDLHARGRPGDAGGAAVRLSGAARSRGACAPSPRPGSRRCSPASWAPSPRNSGFSAFAITSAANVRTLALVEVLFAQGVTHLIFKQPTTTRELAGIVLVVIGVALLVWAY